MRYMMFALGMVVTSFCLSAHAQTASQNSGAAAGAVTGAATGAVVCGPVGAVVGGVIGATAGAALAAPYTTQVQQYVVRQNHPSIVVQQPVVVGQPLPRTVQLYAIPAEVGVQPAQPRWEAPTFATR